MKAIMGFMVDVAAVAGEWIGIGLVAFCGALAFLG